MNYANLKCAMHNSDLKTFKECLNRPLSYSQCEILVHACFFGKVKFVKVLLDRLLVHSVDHAFEAVRICNKKKYIILTDMVTKHLGRIIITHFYVKQAIDILSDHDLRIVLENVPKYLTDLWKCKRVNTLAEIMIHKLRTFLNGIGDIYLEMEILSRHPICRFVNMFEMLQK